MRMLSAIICSLLFCQHNHLTIVDIVAEVSCFFSGQGLLGSITITVGQFFIGISIEVPDVEVSTLRKHHLLRFHSL